MGDPYHWAPVNLRFQGYVKTNPEKGVCKEVQRFSAKRIDAVVNLSVRQQKYT